MPLLVGVPSCSTSLPAHETLKIPDDPEQNKKAILTKNLMEFLVLRKTLRMFHPEKKCQGMFRRNLYPGEESSPGADGSIEPKEASNCDLWEKWLRYEPVLPEETAELEDETSPMDAHLRQQQSQRLWPRRRADQKKNQIEISLDKGGRSKHGTSKLSRGTSNLEQEQS